MKKSFLAGGIIMTILSFGVLAFGLLSVTLSLFGDTDNIVYILSIIGFAILGFIGRLLLNVYCRESGKNVLAIIFAILTYPQYFVLALIVGLICAFINVILIALGKDKISSPSLRGLGGKKIYVIKDENYNERKLVEYDRYGGERHYKDDLGNLWLSKDEGKTFYRK